MNSTATVASESVGDSLANRLLGNDSRFWTFWVSANFPNCFHTSVVVGTEAACLSYSGRFHQEVNEPGWGEALMLARINLEANSGLRFDRSMPTRAIRKITMHFASRRCFKVFGSHQK